MDPVSGLKDDVLRSLVTLLIPGVFAAAPFALVGVYYFPEIKLILNSAVGAGTAILFVGLLAGMVLEDVGSRIELLLWHGFARETKKEWYRYLRLRIKDDLIGQRYLKSILVRMKFELAMIPASIAFLVGATWYNLAAHLLATCTMVILAVGLLVLLAYFLAEAIASVRLLADIRKQILIASDKSAGGGMGGA